MKYTEQCSADYWYESLLWNDSHAFIGQFEHPQHGLYYIWFIDGAFGISKEDKKPHCAYATLSALFKAKGF